MSYFGFDQAFFPSLQPLFAAHGYLKESVASRLSLKQGIPVSYKAGDQPNNALSLNVLKPGEVAATAGTSGVIYGVCDELNYDQQSRINSFAHVNHTADKKRIGVLLCINGTGIFNSGSKILLAVTILTMDLTKTAAKIPVGSDGLIALPFGNGAERMLNNEIDWCAFSWTGFQYSYGCTHGSGRAGRHCFFISLWPGYYAGQWH